MGCRLQTPVPFSSPRVRERTAQPPPQVRWEAGGREAELHTRGRCPHPMRVTGQPQASLGTWVLGLSPHKALAYMHLFCSQGSAVEEPLSS